MQVDKIELYVHLDFSGFTFGIRGFRPRIDENMSSSLIILFLGRFLPVIFLKLYCKRLNNRFFLHLRLKANYGLIEASVRKQTKIRWQLVY